RPHDLRRQTIEFAIASIADDQPLLGIEHGEALHHVLERDVQLCAFSLEFAGDGPQDRLLPLLLRDVIEREDETALEPRIAAGSGEYAIGRKRIEVERFRSPGAGPIVSHDLVDTAVPKRTRLRRVSQDVLEVAA